MNPHGLQRVIALTLALLACGGNGQGPEEILVASVTVSPPSSVLEIGGAVQLEAEVRSGGGDLLTRPTTWNSSSSATATVSSTGLVTAVSEGAATIFATVETKAGSASVLVEDTSMPESPSDLSATPLSNAEIEVTWTDNSTKEDEFRIDREDAGASLAETEGGPALVYTQVGVVGANTTSFRDTGLASGTSYRYQVRACNGNGCSESSSGSTEVTTYSELIIETTTLPAGHVGQVYAQTLIASGGHGSSGWSLADGSLPNGLTLTGTGILSGTPTAGGTFGFTVQVVGGGQTATKALSITVSWPAVNITTTSLPDGTTGSAYSETLAAVGGDGSYTWAVSVGSLPAGLSLAPASGVISGTPTTPGTSAFTVQVTSGGLTATAALSLTVDAVLTVTTSSLPGGTAGTAYSATLAAFGGSGGLTWSLASGTLPAGLSLSGGGILSGTPTAGGTFGFTVQVVGGGQTATKALSITVSWPAVNITTTSLPDGTTGSAYSETLAAVGGDGSYTWAVSVGSLPAGLSLAPASGVISGTPTADGTTYFTARVTSAGSANIQALSLVIDPAGGPGLTNECSSPGSGWIWCDDFESNRLGSYFEHVNPGSFSRESGVGVNGSSGMQAHFTTGLVNAGNLKLAFGRTPDPYMNPVDNGTSDYRDVYWRVFLKHQPGWTGGGGDKLSRAMIFAGSDWSQAAIGHVWSGGSGSNYLYLDPASGTDAAGNLQTTGYNDFANLRWLGSQTSSTPIFNSAHVGVWYCVEARMSLNDAGSSNGVFQLWIDGALEAQRTGLNWVGAYNSYGINAIFLENYWNAGSTQEQYRYFDNFVVSTAPIGCGGS